MTPTERIELLRFRIRAERRRPRRRPIAIANAPANKLEPSVELSTHPVFCDCDGCLNGDHS